ncbi:putative ovule protein [Abeliophyllum distichum]|uniref:Ovule protein n=1 Tax=Abeliophyllum distichum TaxID=126358 RepID=A0ABD1VAR4_9LAMI
MMQIPRKKSKRESDQHSNVKKINPEGAVDLDDFQTSGGDLGRFGHGSYSGLPNKVALKEKKKNRGKNPIDKSIEKERQVRKYRAKLPLHLTMDAIESLRKDLRSEPLSMAATSSSSKIFDSRKTRVNCKKVKGSPEESVSSSSMRMSNLNKVLLVRMETTKKVDSMLNDFSQIRK